MRNRLGIRSSYSILYGVRSPAAIMDRLATAGAQTVGITDRDNLYGVHTIIEEAKARNIRPIIGSELTSPDGSVYAFVENRTGFGNLCEILTEKKRDSSYDLAKALAGRSQGLILVATSSSLIESLSDRVSTLYAGVSPHSIATVREATKRNIPLAALEDATFLDTDDWAVHLVLRAIDKGKTVGTLSPSDCATPGSELLLSAREIERSLASWPEAFRGNDKIAAKCRFDTVFDGFVFPGYDPAPEKTPADLLRRRVLEGAERRYGELSDAILTRIDYELAIIEKKGFAPYILVMDDIVSMASRTCGRGSGAASIVSYALDITNVDPIAYNLYFERFLNPARPDPPDIDVDFAWDERDSLIAQVIDHFGKDHCARVANHNMFRPRSALRETAKAYGLPDAEISKLERSIFDLGENSPDIDSLWLEIFSLATRIEGLPRGLSMHCGGLVITPGLIDRYAPIEKSADGYPLLAWEKEGTEAAGLVKIDLLGNRSLAVIRDALKNLEGEGIHIEPEQWHPADDPETISALARGDSMGVFYIESPAMRQLQIKSGRGDFDHIVIHSSMIRPAANKYINEYVRRLKGGEWKPLHPRLAKILDETYGILCYQEDVSKTAIALAGFDDVDADKLRKVIAKKSGGSKLGEYEERFFEGCRKNNVDEQTIKSVWAMMLSFDGYSFCKPHSASYAMVSFQSAYLRVHHPAHLMAAVLSNQGGYYRPQAYISEARRMGLEIVGPDINRSDIAYRGEGRTVVVGLMAIAGLSRTGLTAITAERQKRGPFSDLHDFSTRLRLSRDDIVSLVASGSFDGISPGVPRSMHARTLLTSLGDKTAGGQSELFPATKQSALVRPKQGSSQLRVQSVKQSEQELRNEFESLGFLRDRHPLSFWSNKLSGMKRAYAIDLPHYIGRKVGLVGWPITQKEAWTVQGLMMNFVSFEDETALFETVLFPEQYSAFRTLLVDQAPLRILGMVVDDQGAISVEIERLGKL